jgi:hypothetical protein
MEEGSPQKEIVSRLYKLIEDRDLLINEFLELYKELNLPRGIAESIRAWKKY